MNTILICLKLLSWVHLVLSYCRDHNTVDIDGGVKERIVLFGDNVELTCCLIGDVSDLSWILPNSSQVLNYFLHPDSGPVYAVPDLLESIGNRHVLHLIIRKFNKDNTGTYTCRDPGNAMVKGAQINLKGRPKIFIDSPKIQYLEEYGDGKIQCRVRGHEKINVAWFFQGKHIMPNNPQPEFSFLIDNQVLQISRVSEMYAGHYLCKAEIEDDEGTAAFIEMLPIRVEVFSSPKVSLESPMLMNQPPYAVEGDMMELACTAYGRPPPQMTWHKEGRQIHPDRKKVFVTTTFKSPPSSTYSVLRVNNLEPEDAGNYSCKSYLEIAAANISRSAEKFLIPDMIFKPRFLKKTVLSREGNTGDNINLNCEIFAAPESKLTVNLEHNNETVKGKKRYDLQKVYSTSRPLSLNLSLSISNAQPEDNGQYTCRAKTDVGIAESVGYVKVWYRPKVTVPIPNVYGLPHFQNILTCEAHGMPNPQWEWRLHGRPITSDNQNYYISIKVKNDISVSDLLVLPSYWNTAKFGTYECIASNKFGNSNSTVHLGQAWRPDRPNVSACNVDVSVVELCITEPNNTGGLPLSHYQVRIQAMPREPFHGPYAYPLGKNVVLKNLIPNSYYRFAVSVVSPAGRSSNAYVQVTTRHLSAPIIELNDQTLSDESNAYRIKWRVVTDGGKPIGDYIIRIRPVEVDENMRVVKPLAEWREYERMATALNEFRVNSLSPNTYYELQMRVRNELGLSTEKLVVFKTRDGPKASYASSLRWKWINNASGLKGMNCIFKVTLLIVTVGIIIIVD